MKKFLTIITALDAEKNVRSWPGPEVYADSFEEAQANLEATGQGYCVVSQEVVFDDIEQFNKMSTIERWSVLTHSNPEC